MGRTMDKKQGEILSMNNVSVQMKNSTEELKSWTDTPKEERWIEEREMKYGQAKKWTHFVVVQICMPSGYVSPTDAKA